MKKFKLLLGVTGAISVSDIIKYIIYLQNFFDIYVVMTESATKLLPIQHLKYYCNKVYSDDIFQTEEVAHIILSNEVDIVLVLPCTANTISKIASGIADSLLSLICLSYSGIIHFFPSMNQSMWENPILQDKVNYLLSKGHMFHNKVNQSYEVASKTIVVSEATLPTPKEVLKMILKSENKVYFNLKERKETGVDV